jgi:hypothetical protein
MDELVKAVQFMESQRKKLPHKFSIVQLLFLDIRFVSQLALFKPKNATFCLDAKRMATQLLNS